MSSLGAPRYCYRHPDRETGLSCSECDRPICYDCMTPAPVGLRCPEHSGKPQGVQRVVQPAQRAVTGVGSSRVNAVTTALIAINVAVYLAELAFGGSFDGTGNWIFNHGALFANGVYTQGSIAPLPIGQTAAGYHAAGVAHGEWWRLMTAAFLHLGPLHLGINMYSLYWVGSLLEQVIGRWRFLLLYLVSGLAGSAGALLLTPSAATVGASGAIFGVLGALFVLERQRHIATGGRIAGLIVINLIFTFAFSGFAFGGSVGGVTISLGGHVGGLIGGVALMWVLLKVRRSTLYSVAAGLALAVFSVALAYWRVRGNA
jgi:membrane associated rhomboid family serine protease